MLVIKYTVINKTNVVIAFMKLVLVFETDVNQINEQIYHYKL
jgi:hypothetical protein